MNQKVKIVNINKDSGCVTIDNGQRQDTLYLSEKPRQFMGKLQLGEAEMSTTTEVDENGMPFVSFIKNTGIAPRAPFTPRAAFNKALGIQRDNSEDRSVSMITSYIKDTALEIYKLGNAKGMIEMDVAFNVAKICVMKAYKEVKEELK
jgi:hypothetical protein